MGFELTTLVVIGTCKSNYHTIKAMTPPRKLECTDIHVPPSLCKSLKNHWHIRLNIQYICERSQVRVLNNYDFYTPVKTSCLKKSGNIWVILLRQILYIYPPLVIFVLFLSKSLVSENKPRENLILLLGYNCNKKNHYKHSYGQQKNYRVNHNKICKGYSIKWQRGILGLLFWVP